MEPANNSALSGEPREALRARLRALGFDEVRFARAGGQEVSLRDWLAKRGIASNFGGRGEVPVAMLDTV